MNDMWNSQYLFVWIFNVGRGIATFMRTPENYGINIDCGGDDEHRPLGKVEKLLLPHLTKYEERRVAQAVMSHPHADHYRDIYRMNGWKSELVTCPNDKDTPDGYEDERFNFDLLDTTEEDEPLLKVYKECYDLRSLPLQTPKLGETVPNFDYGIFYIRPPVVEDELPKNDYVNNCSIMAFVRFGKSSILLPGDMMTSGMDHAIKTGCEARMTGSGIPDGCRLKTVSQGAFEDWLRKFGCKFLVAPHHGLESAWPEALFDLLEEEGRFVSLAIISEKAKPGKTDGKVDERYRSEDYVRGYTVFGNDTPSKRRRSVTTRTDGNIMLALHHTGKPVVVVSEDVDWLLTEAPKAVVGGKFRKPRSLIEAATRPPTRYRPAGPVRRPRYPGPRS